MAITRRQKQILDYLQGFIDDHGYSPSFAEVAEGLGLRSVATVHKHFVNLEKKGLIKRTPRSSRGVDLSPDGATRPAAQVDASLLARAAQRGAAANTDQPRAYAVPLAGRIAAGRPVEAIEDHETITLPESMLGRGETFVLKVRGNSMIDDHICDGDFVVIDKRDTASDGEVVVALVDETEATLKRMYREPGGRIRLQPANATMEPIIVDAAKLRVQGVVVGLLRRF